MQNYDYYAKCQPFLLREREIICNQNDSLKIGNIQQHFIQLHNKYKYEFDCLKGLMTTSSMKKAQRNEIS